MKNKKMQELENRKMEQLEKLKIENESSDYLETYEYELEVQISNRELLNDVINDVLKF